MISISAEEIIKQLRIANSDEFVLLERALSGDTRKGVIKALDTARKRLEAESVEAKRLNEMYSFEENLANKLSSKSFDDLVIVGLDEVGRGPMAGPLAVGAVILPRKSHIEGLNDSKKIRHDLREVIAKQIISSSLAWHVEYVNPQVIDDIGISAALKRAFSCALQAIEDKGFVADVVLVDGNPLNIDSREINVIKGDGKCASIAAASIVAKVSRDALMNDLAKNYPQYGFESNKGYGTEEHRSAISEFGLTPIHRKSFCMEFLQETLF